jgi:hypothetical protein
LLDNIPNKPAYPRVKVMADPQCFGEPAELSR